MSKELTPYTVVTTDFDECADPSGLTREEIRAIMEDIYNEQEKTR